MRLTILLFFSFFFSFNSFSLNKCKVWFKNQKIKTGKDCLIECSIALTDMGTFDCPQFCTQLCKVSRKEQIVFDLTYYYGLTFAERAILAKHTKKSIIAYKLSKKAESMCLIFFEKSLTNDASDACRHFIWATLLYKEFGLTFSKKLLNAHEADIKQPLVEKQMDLKNNHLGLKIARSLSKKGKLSDLDILKSFQDNWEKGNFIVLKKNLVNIRKQGGKK